MIIFYWVYSLLLILVAVYSYVLVDPNFTLINHSLWTTFRNQLVLIGYHNRNWSAGLFLLFLLLLYIFHYYFVTHCEKVDFKKLLTITGAILLLAYPFLSHDFFNYLFDAKILTFYHQNPYQLTALDFPADSWTRFMHWTHRTYPYGPIFLRLTIIPSFLSLGKFILSFFLMKIFFIGLFSYSLQLISKLNKTWAIFLLTNPLLIIEGYLNLHNDWVALSLGLIGVYFLFKKQNLFGRGWLILSAGIKYLSLPTIILNKQKQSWLNYLAFLGMIVILVYLFFSAEIQPWYFLNLFLFLPFFPKVIERLNVFFLGLLLSYLPYIYLGEWDKEKLFLKHSIIIIALGINIIILASGYLFNQKASRK